MKGIVLAGGTGSRLLPLTKSLNKHTLPVGREPMVFHPVRKLIAAGIREILIVTGAEHMGTLVSTLGSGAEFEADFTYKVQDRAGGIAEALGLARNFTHGDRMVVILGDNIFQDDISPFVAKFAKQKNGARLLLKEVPDPERFGVAEVKGTKISGIEEKPKKPKSKLCVTGIYMYDEHVYDLVKGLKPSRRGELEITDVNNGYIAKDQLEFDTLSGWWTDAGTFESLARANELVLKGT